MKTYKEMMTDYYKIVFIRSYNSLFIRILIELWEASKSRWSSKAGG